MNFASTSRGTDDAAFDRPDTDPVTPDASESPPVKSAAAKSAKAATPRSLLVSFFGAYGRELGGWIAVADLVTLLGDLGVDAPAVRSAVSRQKQRGFLEAQQRDGVAGYRLSSEAQEILADGDRRIYQRRIAKLSDGWVMAVFSVPESERHRRHVLRSRLARLGFGSAAPGVWIAPAHLTDEARHTLDRLGLTAYVDLFHADYLAYADLREAVVRWWDLSAVQNGYAEFTEQFEDVDTSLTDDALAFATYLRALDAWRRMPYRDPGLPDRLLPSDWRGVRAADVFFDVHEKLRGPGLRHVRSIVGG